MLHGSYSHKAVSLWFKYLSPQYILVLTVPFDSYHWAAILSNAIYFFKKFLSLALLYRKQQNERINFVSENTCGHCEKVLFDSECINSNDDASVQCGCFCKGRRWFHWKCVNYKATDENKAILKKLSVGGNISDKKVNRKEGKFFFKEHFQIFCKCGSYKYLISRKRT